MTITARAGTWLFVWAMLATTPLTADPVALYTELAEPGQFKVNGEPTGFMVEMVEAIARDAGDEATVSLFPWRRAFQAAQEEPNRAVFPTTRTPEREPLFQWVGPLYVVEWVLYGLSSASLPEINRIEDAAGVPGIGVYNGDARERYLRQLGFDNLVVAPRPASLWRMLEQRRITLLVASNILSVPMLEGAGLTAADLDKVLTFREVELYLAFSPATDPAVVERWQASFERLTASGEIQRILDAWLVDANRPDPS